MTVIRELVTRWGLDVDTKKLDDFEQKFSGVVSVAKGATAVFAASGAALSAIVVPAAALTSKLAPVAALAGVTGEAFNGLVQDLSETANVLSVRFGKSADEVVPLLAKMQTEGIKAGAQMDALASQSLQAAKVLGVDATAAFDFADATMDTLGATAEQTAGFFDVLTVASQKGSNEIGAVMADVKAALPVLAPLGNGFRDVVEVVSAMQRAGVKGVRGLAAIMAAMRRLSAPTGETEKAMKRLGLVVRDANGRMLPAMEILRKVRDATVNLGGAEKDAAFKALFGERAFVVMAQAMNRGMAGADEFARALDKSGGALESTFALIMGADAAAQLDRVKEGFVSIARALGFGFSPAVTTALKGFADFLERVTVFLQENPRVAKAIGVVLAFVAGLSGLIAGVATAIFLWTTFSGAIAAAASVLGGIAAFFAPILAVVGAVVALYLVFEDLLGGMQGQDSLIGRLMEKYPEWAGWINVAAVALAGIAAAILLATSPLLLLGVLIAVLAKAWASNWDEMQAAAAAFPEFMQYVWDDIVKIFTAGYDWVVGKMTDLWEFLKHPLGTDAARSAQPFNAPLPTTAGASVSNQNQTISGNRVEVNVAVPPGTDARGVVREAAKGGAFGWDEMMRQVEKRIHH